MIITETQQILVGKSYKNFRKGGGVCGVRLREVGRGMSIAGGRWSDVTWEWALATTSGETILVMRLNFNTQFVWGIIKNHYICITKLKNYENNAGGGKLTG